VISQTTEQAEEAARLQQAILDTNTQVKTIKGIGFVKIGRVNQLNRFRAAWIGSRPDKFRLEILLTTGQPSVSFASDGKRNYLLSYADNRLYRRKASENGLKRLVSIAMTPKDILDLLSGRLPVRPESRAVLEGRSGNGAPVRPESRAMIEEPSGVGAPVIMLETSKRGARDRIYPVTAAGKTFFKLERYDRKGRLKFRAVFEKMREADGVRIPETLTITNENGAMIQIDIDRCWVNPDVSDDRFVLRLPE
jgi:hypothetical protein